MAVVPRAPTSRALRLRGDYAAAAPDYRVEQRWEQYRREDHRTWQRLNERQAPLLPTHAAAQFRAGLARLGVTCEQIPRLDAVSDRLEALTGWRLVGVPGLIPEARFFAQLAARRFPVTTWMRRPEELDYLAEPDLFHDFFDHVPLLAEAALADFVAAYGRRGTALAREHPASLRPLARLYWYGVEFGLLRAPGGWLPAICGGILSSHAESRHAIKPAAALPRSFAFRSSRRRMIASSLASTSLVSSNSSMSAAAEPSNTRSIRSVSMFRPTPCSSTCDEYVNARPTFSRRR